MPRTHRRTFVPGHSARSLWDWHLTDGSFERLVPPWHRVTLERFPTPFEAGRHAELVQQLGPLRLRWRSVLERVSEPTGFVDVAPDGLFARWRHVHQFSDADGGAWLEDDLDWAPPAGAVGRWVAGAALADELRAFLGFRHARTVRDLARHDAFRDRPRLTVGITGASGLVGGHLATFLRSGGHRVVPFVRRPAGPDEIRWDVREGVLDPAALVELDAVVHLAGEPIAGRWTPTRKAAIRDSRVDGTALLAGALAEAGGRCRVLVSGSAVGIYGDRGTPVDEDSALGTDFLAEVARVWEAAAEPARQAGIRVVHPRIGIVQSARGAALASQLPVFRAGLGGPLGTGRQPLPWVALDDLVAILHHLLWADDLSGPVNAVSPQPVTQGAHAATLGEVMRRPACAPMPEVAVRALFGEMGQAVLLQGAAVQPRRLLDAGFHWDLPRLEDALRWELGRWDG